MQSPNHHDNDVADLYLEHGDILRRFIAGRLPFGDAADLVHDTFIRLLSRMEVHELHSPRPYLFQIACNLIKDHLRSKHYQSQEPYNDSAQQLRDDLTPETQVYEQQRLTILHQAIDELPPRCREVFLLHKFEHLSQAKIAARLGISINMVEKHMIKALTHCRNRLASLD